MTKSIPQQKSDRVTALLLIAHGSRQEEANEDLYHFVSELGTKGAYPIVEASFLELAEPNIETGSLRCIDQGATQVILLPYFLSAGVHVRRDLTAIGRRLAKRFPDVNFLLAEPMGRHPLLLDVVTDRAREAGHLCSTDD
jgi:sirohydrochlorin ferrochelatase